MDIMAGVLPVSCPTPPWCRQHADLLVVANGFCWNACGMGELANRQRSFHGRSFLCDWKVKGWIRPMEKFFARIPRCTGNRLLRQGAEDITRDSGRPCQALSHLR
jgi:hypothetical protein